MKPMRMLELWLATALSVVLVYVAVQDELLRDAYRDAHLAAAHWRYQNGKTDGSPIDGYGPTTYYFTCLDFASDVAFYLTDGVEPDMSKLEDRWFPRCSPLWRDVRCEDEGREEVCMLHESKAPYQ